jgi:uncharacterized membrane protein YccC
VTIAAMTDGPELRASDEQRERAAAEIRHHFAEGRLSADELGERLDAVYRARTEGELQALRADLPALPATREQARTEIAQRRSRLRRELLQQTGGGLVIFLVCVAIWAISGASGGFWPGWVALIVLIPLLRNGWRLYGPAPELDRVEEELARRRARDARRGGRRRRRT